jgi:tRNA-modifying protein YgfZ
MTNNNDVLIYDRSCSGTIKVSDSDRLRFLHNQSTNDFQSLKVGAGCDTVFVTSTARTIDLVNAYILEDEILLLVSANRREKLMKWLDGFIFFADQVKLTDITESTAVFNLIGAESDEIINKLGCAEILGKPYGNHQLFTVNNRQIRIAVGSGLAIHGYTIITTRENHAQIQALLTENGGNMISDRQWETLRITQGRPVPDQELTEDYNPLEVGLWQTLSFNKGCYIGQETIARLNTYKGVKQLLWGIKLNDPVEIGSIITKGDKKIGKITSFVETETGYLGLGYIRTKDGGEGLKIEVGNTTGEVIKLPFLNHPPE